MSRNETPPLAQHTSLRVGGPPDRWVAPAAEEEVRAALLEAADRGEPVRALGGGKNLLVDDRGVDGTVISFAALTEVRFDGSLVIARGGAPLASLVGQTAAAGLGGITALAGIPGTVGGAVRMNAGGRLGSIGERVAWVEGFTETGEPFTLDGDACGFGYRESLLRGRFVTEVALSLTRSGTDLRARVREIRAEKMATQPLDAATAGCMFKNPGPPGRESAGRLLEEAGMKGLCRGGARISSVHANFVENVGGGTCEEILWLLAEGRRRVRDRFGVDLELEVVVWRRAARDGPPAAPGIG